MGSASAFHLASRGLKVLGLDRLEPPHTMGSTHGGTRIIREAYFERPVYVPLVQRAYTLWEELEAQSGASIYRKTGGLMLGPENGAVVSGSRASALGHRIPHEMLTAGEVRRRFPGFTPPDHFVALWEERAGLLFPEVAVRAHLALARAAGAELHFSAALESWEADEKGVLLQTSEGRFRAAALVLSLGPWIQGLIRLPRPLFSVERQLFHWFEPKLDTSAWPVALWEHRPGGLFATLPDSAYSLKMGVHHEGEIVDPDRVSRSTTDAEEDRTRSLLATYLPVGNGRLQATAVCLYTNTSDGHFLIDRHPAHSNVLVVSPCSGHGFKFSSAIGEVVADLITRGQSRFDLSPFGFARLM